MRDHPYRFIICLLVFFPQLLYGQISPQGQAPSSSADGSMTKLNQELESISAALVQTRQQLDQSQQQMQQLQEEMARLRNQLATLQTSPPVNNEAIGESPAAGLRERVETLEAQVKLHDQAKVESSSKYPVHLTGLVLFNSFVNRGAVDNIDLPSIAVIPAAGSNGNVGATMRQTILGIKGYGPRIAGARTSAEVSMDFFGGIPYTNYGTSSGIVRMRTANIFMDWDRNSLRVGVEEPLISPLSPTSYATVAQPGLAWAGNLWAWAPQLRFAHQFLKSEDQHFQLELGLLDPPAAGYNAITNTFRTPSPGEEANQPAYEGRVSYDRIGVGRGLRIGVGGYYSRQKYLQTADMEYPNNRRNNSWAVTTDWRLPFAHRFELSGEGYRGRSLGGLGGGVYKDVLYGSDPIKGYATLRGLNDIGGWTQIKSRFGSSLESNAFIGLDNGFAGDFHAVALPETATATELRARNRMAAVNLIYRPRTYLILSPEYRRIWTWPISGTRSTADVITISMGYEF
jgi:uncharacterized coiled-coil protein SlyX